MRTLTRVLKRRWQLTLVLCCLCLVFIFEYQQLAGLEGKQVATVHRRQNRVVEAPAAVNLSKFKDISEVYSEVMLDDIRRLIANETVKTADLDPRIASLNGVPKGIAQKVDELILHKKSGIYVEIGMGMNDGDDLIQWLEQAMGWSGLVLEPSLMNYTIKNGDRRNKRVFKSCLQVGNKTWDHTRDTHVAQKCFPLGAVMQAAFPNDKPEPEILIINSEGKELDILGAFPLKTFKVGIVVISLKGALTDTVNFQKLMDLRGYKGQLIANNHFTGMTHVVYQRRDLTGPSM